jgi:hypothetical protein
MDGVCHSSEEDYGAAAAEGLVVDCNDGDQEE